MEQGRVLNEPTVETTCLSEAGHLAGESESESATNLTPLKKRDRTPLQRRKFLGALGENPNVTAACRRAAISRESAYAWRKTDDEFASAWTNAIEMAIDSLEGEAIRRAKKDSDLLMIFLLKMHARPRTGRDTSTTSKICRR